MAEAKALFQKHWKEYCGGSDCFSMEQNQQRAILYAAAMIVEAIKNEEDIEARVCRRCSQVAE